VTTFRVAALTWGALLLTALHLAPWWAGLAYGVGFVIPVTKLLVDPRIGRAAVGSGSLQDPGLHALLARRPRLQLVSLLLLTCSSALLVLEMLG
ncbi:MAG: hypothetical protein MI919_24840, partial [Holophagales bacterium]|nr:hypothetical protein [Holophagales bacterium]